MYLATDDGSNSTKGRVINDECFSSSSSSSCSSTLSRSIRLICDERKGFSLFFFYFSFLCANLFASFMIVFIIFVHTIELYSWFGLFITHTPRLCSCCSISSYIENSFSLSAISSRRLSHFHRSIRFGRYFMFFCWFCLRFSIQIILYLCVIP